MNTCVDFNSIDYWLLFIYLIEKTEVQEKQFPTETINFSREWPGYVPHGNEWIISGNHCMNIYFTDNASCISISLIYYG